MKNTLYNLLNKSILFPPLRKLYRFYRFCSNKIQYSMDYEKPVQLGKLNPNVTFFLIGYYQDSYFQRQGIISTWLVFMPQVLYAIDKGYIPIIDLQNNYKPMMLDKDNIGKFNAWDIYFKQAYNKYSLSEILQSKNVIFAKQQGIELSKDIQWSNLPLSFNDFKLIRNMLKYSELSDEIIKRGDDFFVSSIPNGKKILGVSFRRGFERLHYFNSDLTPPGTHLVRGTLEDIIVHIKKALKALKYEYFFFTADDRESYDTIKKEFGDKCIYSQRPVYHMFENNKPVPLAEVEQTWIEFYKRKNDVMLRGIEYLTDIYIISKCDSLLSAGGSSDLFAYVLNNKRYESVIRL